MKKVAIVTGGTKGLGKEISIKLANLGYKVYAPSSNPDKVKNIIPIKLDLSKKSNCIELISKVVKKEKRLDLLVNNAGVNIPNLEKMMDINFYAPYYITQESHKHLKKTKGKIINITSLNAVVPTPYSAEYSATKHAIYAYFESISYSLTKDKINVTNIIPGAIFNPNAKSMPYKTLRQKNFFINKFFPLITSETVSEKVLEIAESINPPSEVVLGRDSMVSYILYRKFPKLWRYIIGYIHK